MVVAYNNYHLDPSIMANLRVLIADDHELVRKGVRSLLESGNGYEVCFEATNGQEAFEKTCELKPDVVVLDLTMPIMSGFESARKIKQTCPAIPVLILSMHKNKHFMEEAKGIGVSGYVLKSEAASALLTAIDAAVQGKAFFPAEE